MSSALPLNGKTGEFVRYLIGLVITALVAYFTAIGAINVELAVAKTKQESFQQEVLRRLDLMQSDIRELRHK